MQSKVELYVYGSGTTSGQIQLYPDEPLSIEYSIQDILDISKRNSSSSQNFTVPANKQTNQLFNHIFNIGSDSSYNPATQTPAYILVDNLMVFQGNLQLINIKVKDKNPISYDIIVYGEVADLSKTLGDSYLTDLNVSEIDHKRTVEFIETSWSSNTSNLGVYYPLIDYGVDLDYNELNTGVITNTYDFGFATTGTTNTIKDSSKFWTVNGYIGYQVNIVDGTGQGQTRTISSNLQDVLTLTANWSTIPDSTSEYTITKADTINPLNSYKVGMNPYIFKPAVSNHYLFNKILNTAGFSYQSNFLNSDVFKETIIPFNGVEPDPQFQQFSVRLAYDYNVNTLIGTEPNRDTFYIRFHRSSLTTGISTNGGPPTCFCQVISRVERYAISPPVVGGPLLKQDYVVQSCMLDNGVNTQQLPANWSMTTTNAWRYPLQAGETVWVELLITNTPVTYQIFNTNTSFFNTIKNIDGSIQPDNINTFQASLSTTLPYINTGATTWLDFNFNDEVTPPNFDYVNVYNTTTHKYTGTDYIDMVEHLPKKIKQVDYCKSIFTMFNLMVVPTKNNPKQLLIETRDNYFSAGTIKNWTTKLDVSQNIDETLINEQQSKQIYFSYSPDKDFYNTEYTEDTFKVYGEHIETIQNEWLDPTSRKEIKCIFSPTPVDSVIGCDEIVIPRIGKNDSNKNFGKTDFNIRFLRKNPTLMPLPSGVTITLQGRNPQNSYPYSGHLDHPFESTIDYNFGTINYAYYNTPGYKNLQYITTNNLVESYWRNTLNNISNKNSKLIRCKIKLTPADMSDFNYNDIIAIEGLSDDGLHYFTVNKIIYTPTSDLPADVELIKI